MLNKSCNSLKEWMRNLDKSIEMPDFIITCLFIVIYFVIFINIILIIHQ